MSQVLDNGLKYHLAINALCLQGSLTTQWLPSARTLFCSKKKGGVAEDAWMIQAPSVQIEKMMRHIVQR
jgi:hypothetical protein